MEAYLLAQNLVSPNGVTTHEPLNAACSDAEYAAMAAGAVKMKF